MRLLSQILSLSPLGCWLGQRPKLIGKTAFPTLLSRETHWQRATSIVELSLARATDVLTNQSAASRQLEAAEYALHSLLSELGSMMSTSVRSPLEARQAVAHVGNRVQSALAA